MSDMNELYSALKNADAAGDTEGAAKIAAYIQSIGNKPAQPVRPTQTVDNSTQEQMVAQEAKDTGWAGRNLAGIGASAADTYYALKQMFGGGLSPQDEQSVKDWRAIAQEAPVGYVAGSIMQTAIPLVGVGGKVMKAAEAIPKIGGSLLGRSMLLNAAGGAAQGALIPTIGNESRAQNMAVYGSLGAGMPAALGLVTGVSRLAANLSAPRISKNAAEVAQGRVLNKLVGEDKQQAVIDAMKNSQSMLTGSPLTAAEASIGTGSTAIPALQEAVKGRAGDSWQAIKEAQRVARTDALKTIDANTLMAERDLVTNPLREKALSIARSAAVLDSKIPPVSSTPILEGIDKKLSDPAFAASEKAQIVKSFRDKIASFTDDKGVINPDALYTIRKDINDTVASLTKGVDPATSNKLAAQVSGELKPLIDAAIEKSSGGNWNKYLNTYSAMSRKVDQANILTRLHGKLAAPLEGGADRASAFSSAVNNEAQTLRQATGFGGYKNLEDVLTKEQLASIKAVQADLNRQSKVQELAKAGADNVARTYGSLKNDVPNIKLLNRYSTIFNSLVNAGQAGVTEKTFKELATALQDPKTVAYLMEKASAKDKAVLQRLINIQTYAPQTYIAGKKD